jgi:hypothetical protein
VTGFGYSVPFEIQSTLSRKTTLNQETATWQYGLELARGIVSLSSARADVNECCKVAAELSRVLDKVL